MLFAFGFSEGQFIVFLIIMALGARQSAKWLKGNDALRGAAKTGALNILGRLFKK